MYDKSESSYDVARKTYNYSTTTEEGIGAGLGLGIGWKWISKSGFVGEIYTGAGRNFVSATQDGVPAYIRSGISLGYRF